MSAPDGAISPSRKRMYDPGDGTRPSKRHLNNALAADLQSLRISTAPLRYAAASQHRQSRVYDHGLPGSPYGNGTVRDSGGSGHTAGTRSNIFGGTFGTSSPFLQSSSSAIPSPSANVSPQFRRYGSTDGEGHDVGEGGGGSDGGSGACGTSTEVVQLVDGVSFGDDFAQSLPPVTATVESGDAMLTADTEPIVTSPPPSASSSTMDEDIACMDTQSKLLPLQQTSASQNRLFSRDITIEEAGADEYNAAGDPLSTSANTMSSRHEQKDENRVVVYKPPLRTTNFSVSALNACLPDGHLAVRHPKTHDWFISRPSEAHKRKLAVVPYVRGGGYTDGSGGAPTGKKLRELVQRPDTVIYMPWTGDMSAGGTAQNARAMDSAMEIEEIS